MNVDYCTQFYRIEGNVVPLESTDIHQDGSHGVAYTIFFVKV